VNPLFNDIYRSINGENSRNAEVYDHDNMVLMNDYTKNIS